MENVLRAFAEVDPNYIFLPSILPILRHICIMIQGLHNPSGVPKSILLTGPRGIGKSWLFRTAGDPTILAAILTDFPTQHTLDTSDDAELGPITILESLDLSGFSEGQTQSLHEWVILQIVDNLKVHENRQNTVDILSCVADIVGSGNQAQDVHPSSKFEAAIRLLPESEERTVALANLTDGRTILKFVSACLVHARVAALFLVDEAECLFKDASFTKGMAALWKSQMLAILAIPNTAIGVVVCASFQRANQLFLTKSGDHTFPDEYTHLSLRSDWNGTKLQHFRMSQPTWTRELLSRYIWATCSKTFGKKRAEQQDSENKRLDALFIRGSEHSDEGGDELRALDASLEHFLRLYGHTPRKVTRALEEKVKSLKPPCRWPDPAPIDRDDVNVHGEAVEQLQRAQRGLAAYIEALDRPLKNLTHLDFDPALYGVPREKIKARLVASDTGSSDTAVSVGSAAMDSKRPALKRATDCIDAAIDGGMLVYIDKGFLSLADPSINVEHVCADTVSPVAVSWLRHKGYGEEAEILVARNLARSPHCGPPDAYVLGLGPSGTAIVSNRDSAASEMATVHLIALSPEGKPLTQKSIRSGDLEELFGDSQSYQEYQLAQAAKQKLTNLRARKAKSTAMDEAKRAVEDHPVLPLWQMLQAAGQEYGMDADSLAAYLSVCRTHSSVRAAILELRQVWVKEAPDAMGGDLLGLVMSVAGADSDGKIMVQTARVQVKIATQDSLSNPKSTAGSDRTHEALKGLLDPAKAATSQNKQSHSVRHEPTVSAVERFMQGVLVCAGDKPEPSSWHEQYNSCQGWLEFEHRRPCIATTHTVPATVRSTCDAAGVDVLDAAGLADYWGDLGVACEALGVLPFATQEGGHAVAGPPDELQRLLDDARARTAKP